jgi:hypothetical protein
MMIVATLLSGLGERFFRARLIAPWFLPESELQQGTGAFEHAWRALSTCAANSGRLRLASLSGVTLRSAVVTGNCGLLALAALLSACANSPTSRVEAAKTEPTRVEGTRVMVQYELVKSAGLDPEEREKRESRAAAAFMPACEKPYTRGLTTLLTGAAEIVRAARTVDVMASLPNQVAILDSDFDRCLGRFGATGYNYVETTDGQDNRVPQYITRAAAPLLNAEETHAGSIEDRQRTGAQMLTALAAIVRAGPQVNSDTSRGRPDTAEADHDDAAPAKPAAPPSRRALSRPSISP